MEIKIQLLQSLPGIFPEDILREWSFVCHSIEVKQISEQNSKEKIIELRLDDATLIYHYEEGFPCHICYLFPDNDDDVEEYIRFFDHHYSSIQSGVWFNQDNQTVLEVIKDEDVGYIISCSKSKMN